MFKPRRSPVIAIALCLFWGCSDTRRAWNDSLGTVEVVEAPPPDALESVPLVPLIQNVPLEQIYLEPPPLPLRHVVQVALFPAGVLIDVDGVGECGQILTRILAHPIPELSERSQSCPIQVRCIYRRCPHTRPQRRDGSRQQ